MGLSDRDYMKAGNVPAGTRPGWWQRLRFWFWCLLRRRS